MAISLVGFDPTTPAFEQAMTVHASDRASTVIGEMFTFFFFFSKTRLRQDGWRPLRIHARDMYSSEMFIFSPKSTKVMKSLKKLRSLSPQANYTDGATTACRRN
jgi:hypothetical protein